MILDPVLDLFRGNAVTIPPFDGAFRPNTRLDDARAAAPLAEADNLARLPDGLVAGSGNTLYRIEAGKEPAPFKSFGAPVAAVAVSPSGELAVATETGALHIGDREEKPHAGIGCVTALAYAADGTLWLANGSADHPRSQWSQDLMRHGSSGSVWKRAPGATSFERVADGLAFPYGLLPLDGGVVVAESWRHRLLRIGAGAPVERLAKLPGYPARLSPAPGGGAWLCLFAPRNRLIEFVLQEEHYRLDMLATVPPPYWIAPSFSSGRSFLEPLQCGGIRTMGVHKPWSPSRSYGMAVRLDEGMQPLFSLHSRANGTRHGVCSVVEEAGRLWVASRGGGCVLDIDLADLAREAR
ncbi:MAG: hypothetical protein J0I98_05690 [Mesorhizobium sp.]|nr:hypothetical protein [Mesorhizobium sp.]MBN9242268.1 hypothetical protein [Mesorhizobium sp.]MBN9271536.1 hypothetical protein [Mesorhizobium sp.]